MEDKDIYTFLELLLRVDQALVLLLEQLDKFITFARVLLQVGDDFISEERIINLYALLRRDKVLV